MSTPSRGVRKRPRVTQGSAVVLDEREGSWVPDGRGVSHWVWDSPDLAPIPAQTAALSPLSDPSVMLDTTTTEQENR